MHKFRFAIALLLSLLATLASAQEYPSRAVKIVVPFAAGGPADVYARFIAQRLQEAMGQPFVVEDRPGGGSVVGTDIVAKSPPDGYTLLLMSNTHTVNESLMPEQAVPADARFHARRADQLFGPRARRQSGRAGEDAAGADRAREGATRQAQLRIVRPRHAVSHGRRALQGDRPASTSCTCRTRRARARAPACSADRSR